MEEWRDINEWNKIKELDLEWKKEEDLSVRFSNRLRNLRKKKRPRKINQNI